MSLGYVLRVSEGMGDPKYLFEPFAVCSQPAHWVNGSDVPLHDSIVELRRTR